MTEPEHGGLKAILTLSGNILVQVHSYGYMANVSVLSAPSFVVALKIFASVAGAGKSVLWCDKPFIICLQGD